MADSEFNAFGIEVEKPVGGVDQEKISGISRENAIVEDQWAAYTRARDAGHLDYVEEARVFDGFYRGDQWEDSVRQTLDAQGRPHHTVNLVLSTVNAVMGEYIRSRQDISFVPTGKGATQETADALRFVFKQIALNNDSEEKEKNVFADGLIQDRGYFYYFLDFSDNIDGEVREEVLDPTDVILDAGATDYDPKTWNEVFISRWMTPEEIGAVYGPRFKEKVDVSAGATTYGHDSVEWEAPVFGGDHYDAEIFYQSSEADVKRVKRVRVIERQYRRLTRTAFFVDTITGDMRRVPEGWSEEKIDDFVADMNGSISLMWKPERRVRITITADRTLLHDGWSLFSNFSVIPYFPYFRRGRPFGLVRNLVSPQEMLNKVTSQELHVVNTTANSGWMFRTGSLVNMDSDDLLQQGSKTGLVLEWDGDVPPQKIQPNSIPTGLDQISQKAGVYFREISGVNEAQLGVGRSDSSKALSSRQQAGLVQQEIMFDNLEYTRTLRGRLILEMVQDYYTETRLMQIISKNEMGVNEQAQLAVNQPVETVDELGMVIEEIQNDLTLGEYSVAITTVPRRDTYDEAVFDQLIQMREIGVIIPDHVLIENSQLPDRMEISEMIKQAQGLAAPTEEEIIMQQQLQALQMRALEAEVVLTEAHAAERAANAQKLQAQAQEALLNPELKQLEIGTDARVRMEEMASKERQNVQDLMTRIQLMRDKTGSAERVAAVQSATKRMDSMVKRQTDLQTTLLSKAGQPASPNS